MTSERGHSCENLGGHFLRAAQCQWSLGRYIRRGPWLLLGRQSSLWGLASSPCVEHPQSKCVEMNLCTTLRRAWSFQVMVPRGIRRWEERGPGDSRELTPKGVKGHLLTPELTSCQSKPIVISPGHFPPPPPPCRTAWDFGYPGHRELRQKPPQ